MSSKTDKKLNVLKIMKRKIWPQKYWLAVKIKREEFIFTSTHGFFCIHFHKNFKNWSWIMWLWESWRCPVLNNKLGFIGLPLSYFFGSRVHMVFWSVLHWPQSSYQNHCWNLKTDKSLAVDIFQIFRESIVCLSAIYVTITYVCKCVRLIF